MTDIVLNLISALAIGLVIFTMSILKVGHLKALVYSLPIPITVALVATNGHVNTSNIIGLFILCGFLWMVYWLVNHKTTIYIADSISSVAYILIGYVAITYIRAPFALSAFAYLIAWLAFISFYKHVSDKKVKSSAKVMPIVKLPIVTILAYALLSLKSYLAGVVVTFPFSGVFAVVESRHSLKTLAAVFTRNSIAILGLFVTMFYLDHMQLGIRIIVGWVVYLVILRIVTKAVKYSQ